MRWAALYRRPPILRGVSASQIRADHAANQARITARYGPADRSFVFCLLKTREGRAISRVRQEFEVNMRECEREQLARRDAYERELERRAKKQKRG